MSVRCVKLDVVSKDSGVCKNNCPESHSSIPLHNITKLNILPGIHKEGISYTAALWSCLVLKRNNLLTDNGVHIVLWRFCRKTCVNVAYALDPCC